MGCGGSSGRVVVAGMVLIARTVYQCCRSWSWCWCWCWSCCWRRRDGSGTLVRLPVRPGDGSLVRRGERFEHWRSQASVVRGREGKGGREEGEEKRRVREGEESVREEKRGVREGEERVREEKRGAREGEERVREEKRGARKGDKEGSTGGLGARRPCGRWARTSTLNTSHRSAWTPRRVDRAARRRRVQAWLTLVPLAERRPPVRRGAQDQPRRLAAGLFCGRGGGGDTCGREGRGEPGGGDERAQERCAR
mmetsp:Transcript_48348/g.135526  ORF Transcript_48348/g.135526 Transcript_48348/m.135526 type:complete len:252 (-) Transcript_48348:75-830(-)